MTLSILLIVLIPLFLIPTFVLSRNKVRFYTIGFGIAAAVVFALQLQDVFFQLGFSSWLADFLKPVFSFFIERSYLTFEEIRHLSGCFGYLLIFFAVYFIVYLFLKIFYIGKNPDIQKTSTKFIAYLDDLLYFIFTYGMLFLFLIEIRQILPLKDGFLSFLFQFIYKIEA